ncbi:CAP domain-containing protein [Natronolimnobius sp. AArcel1]|uniref:CAP domain-containing protein n=1 Tax=Natronolimnobius sp. AArcel1 TaxID=1679093 RepID=UPI0013EAB6F7|nr:CAP domain-containing protein [Natronolimnobius sp. AArcel1]NGM69041.1 CAP domain-containing protein [Natronolimnobius sp. AArcel1]
MARGPSSEPDEHGADRPGSSVHSTRESPPPRRDGDRGLLRGLLSLLLVCVLLAGLFVGALALSPMTLEEVREIDSLDDLDDIVIDTGPMPDPSADPPPAGERDPEVTDPDDPGESTYETEVETVSSATVEDFVHAEVNDRRAEHDLEALEWDGTVASVSRAHSVDMAEREYFDHVNPDDEGPYDRFDAVDSYCRAYGENIALTWVDRPIDDPGEDETIRYQTAERLATGLVDQWMNSQPHREAILEDHGGPGWDRGGVGVYIDDDGAVYASHNFCLT